VAHKNELVSVAVVRKALKEWRKERHLTRENQFSGLINNLLEEVNELKEAKDDYEKIDAYCDMAVFAFNVLDDDYEIAINIANQSREYLGNATALEVTILGLSEDLKKHPDISNELLVNFIEYLFSNIYYLGFNWFKCMIETIKEINSRVGKWDESRKKWVKDKSSEAVANWYKANYKECRNEM
jgi:hypothetical protein